MVDIILDGWVWTVKKYTTPTHPYGTLILAKGKQTIYKDISCQMVSAVEKNKRS